MAKSAVAGKVNIGFNIPEKLAARIDGIAEVKGVNRTAVLMEALNEYVERHENPNLEEERILAVLERNPDYLEKPVRAIIEKIAARQLSK